jgi:cysteine desulfurase / selenocysteine lyase
MKPIYFDNAATSWPKPPLMMEAMIKFNESVGANPGRSGHHLSVNSSRVVFGARELMAELTGASDPLSIAFTKNATEAINTALVGILKAGDHVVASAMEHNSVMRPLRHLEQQGVEVSLIPCSNEGCLDPNDVAEHLKENTKIVLMTHASNVTGTLLPIGDIAAIAHDHQALFVVNAAQTAGSIPIDVERSGIDILCFSGHKSLMGPQGTGGLYIKNGLSSLIDPLMRGGTGSASEYEEQPDFMPDKFESGTPNAIGLAGLAGGVRFVLDTGVARIREKELALTRQFLDGIMSLPDATVYGPDDNNLRTSVVSFNIKGMSPSKVAYVLDEEFSLCCRPGLHCAPSAHHTIGTFPTGAVRFSFGYFTTADEIQQGIEALKSLCDKNLSTKGGKHV